MYFQPFAVTDQQLQDAAVYESIAQMCLEAVGRQQRLHVEILHDYCAQQRDVLRRLAESVDDRALFLNCLAHAAPAPLDLWRASLRSGSIVADVQQRIVALLGRRAKEVAVAAIADDTVLPSAGNGSTRGRDRDRERQAA